MSLLTLSPLEATLEITHPIRQRRVAAGLSRNQLGLLLDLDPAQETLLDRVLAGPLISDEELRVAGAFELPPPPKGKAKAQEGATLFDL